MAITPIVVTRVSHNLQTMSLVESLRTNTLNMYREQIRLSTGMKFLTPSEDPVEAMRAVKLSELAEQQDQILQNLQFADKFLAQTDSTINDIQDLLLESQSIASENVNSTTSQEERESAALIIDRHIQQLVAIGNRQFQDVYQFAGQKTNTIPFVEDDTEVGGIRYDGDTGDLMSQVDLFQFDAFNLTGDQLFGALSGEVKGFADLTPGVTADTRLSDLNGALNGEVSKGTIRIHDSSVVGGSYTVDLSGADTLGDVADLINDANTRNGGGITASLTSTGIRIDAAGGVTVGVTEVGNGLTAGQLGIRQWPAIAGTISGQNLNARLTMTTPVGSLKGGAGVDLSSGIRIQNGQKTATVDLSGANTVQDILNAINGAEVGVQAKLNADCTGIDVVNRVSGANLSIGENGGSTATDLGIRSYHSDSLLSGFNHGSGVQSIEGQVDFTIHDANGVSIDVDVTGALTVGDVLDRINAAAAAAGSTLTASLASVGNGICLSHPAAGSQAITIERRNLSFAVDDLGLADKVGTTQELTSDDTNQIRVDGVFTALIDLRDALRSGSTADITDAASRLDTATEEITQVHGEVGSRSQAIQSRLTFTEDAVLATQKLLSEAQDLDYTTAVTEFQQAQTALQANLLTGAQLLQMSLLDYL
jgi:flagellar hook-associated protein 3 FlgL